MRVSSFSQDVRSVHDVIHLHESKPALDRLEDVWNVRIAHLPRIELLIAYAKPGLAVVLGREDHWKGSLDLRCLCHPQLKHLCLEGIFSLIRGYLVLRNMVQREFSASLPVICWWYVFRCLGSSQVAVLHVWNWNSILLHRCGISRSRLMIFLVHAISSMTSWTFSTCLCSSFLASRASARLWTKLISTSLLSNYIRSGAKISY